MYLPLRYVIGFSPHPLPHTGGFFLHGENMGTVLLRILTFIEILVFLKRARQNDNDIHSRQRTDTVHAEDESSGSDVLDDTQPEKD